MSTPTEKFPEKPKEIKFLHHCPSDSKKRPFSSPNEMVTFIIRKGDKQETFQIHKQIACQHSEVWDRAFNSAFLEGETQTYHLEDNEDLCAREDVLLAEPWILAERFLIRPLQNYTMQVMFRKQVTCGAMNAACYEHLYENTAKYSILRRFAVEQRCWLGGDFPGLSEECFPAQMLFDMIGVLQERLAADVRKRKCFELGKDMEGCLVGELWDDHDL
ncbi:hypothetical protein EAF04_000034 [Stromatinia cepivora]|nr:hypothetical protein EAF04_000034 [Stromatinia cepivora]